MTLMTMVQSKKTKGKGRGKEWGLAEGWPMASSQTLYCEHAEGVCHSLRGELWRKERRWFSIEVFTSSILVWKLEAWHFLLLWMSVLVKRTFPSWFQDSALLWHSYQFFKRTFHLQLSSICSDNLRDLEIEVRPECWASCSLDLLSQ